MYAHNWPLSMADCETIHFHSDKFSVSFWFFGFHFGFFNMICYTEQVSLQFETFRKNLDLHGFQTNWNH